MAQLREAQLEFLADGVHLTWTTGESAGPFASLELAEQFLDWCENQQRAQRASHAPQSPAEESRLRTCL
jgi:hypothetical protein